MTPHPPGLGSPSPPEAEALGQRLFELSRSVEVFRLRPQEVQLIIDLKQRGAVGLQFLLERLRVADALERCLIAQFLANFSDPAAARALFQLALEDGDPRVGAEAGRSLALMDSDVALDCLHELARCTKSLPTFLNAVFGLCRHRDAHGIVLAERCFRDHGVAPVQRATLAISVATLQYPELLGLIGQIIETFPWVPNIMSQVVSCCEAIGTPSALQRLAAVAADDRVPDEARTRARTVLANIN